MNHLVKYLTLLMGILSASHIAAFGFTSSPSPATATATHRSLLSASSARSIGAFTAVNRAHATKASIRSKSALKAEEEGASAAAADPNDLIARRLFVVGDVSGGYYRSCVKNEVRQVLNYPLS